MATKYLLSWMAGKNRWRKRYKGRSYYFPRRPDETKEQSYRRAVLEWTQKRADIDKGAEVEKPHLRMLKDVVNAEKARLLEISQGEDTPETRARWRFHKLLLDNYESVLSGTKTKGVLTGGKPFETWNDANGTFLAIEMEPEPKEPPPWANAAPTVFEGQTLLAHIDEFVAEKRKQAEQGKLAAGRAEAIRIGLNPLLQVSSAGSPVSAVNADTLRRVKKELETAIDAGKLKPHTARDRLAIVKQFVTWLWENELIDMPRNLKSKSLSIPVATKKIDTFTDEELGRLLGAANGRTKLYLLLMLNCGMTQKDLADLKQTEVDWKLGRITRKRSKTKKWDDVPTVTYQLWPQTFALLREYRSDHAELALTNENGGPLKFERFAGAKMQKSDAVKSAYSRLLVKLANHKTDPIKIAKPLKLFRKTAATLLSEHPTYSRFAQYFLGHAPESTADKFYIVPSADQFDEAVKWLGSRLLTSPVRASKS